MSKLFIYPKKGDPFHFQLKTETVSVGRASENDIPINDPFCSSRHALFMPKEDAYFLCDNNSKNGVFLNSKRIQDEVKLKKGDEILLGSTRIVFDLKLATNVEVTDTPSSSANINTIMHLKDILKKPKISTTINAPAEGFDIDLIRSEHKDFSVISEVSKALILHKPLNELLEHIMDLICENVQMDRGIMMLKEGQPSQLIPKVVRINNPELRKQKIQVSQSIISTVVEKHAAVLISDTQSDTRFRAQESILKLNIQSAMCVPLWNNKEIIGIIYADKTSLLNPFTGEDLRLLTLLSNLAAVKIENAKLFEKSLEQEKMEKELALASQIQKDLLPKKNPEFTNFDIAGANVSCYQVGGDYYDFVNVDSDRLVITIADVSGKGVSSSLLMASLRAALHSDIHPEYDPEKISSKLNNFVHRSSSPHSFITFFFCELNHRTRDLRYINAGHNPPIHFTKDRKVNRLESSGLCLGMFPDINYKSESITLKPGDILLLYTDGFTESRDKQNNEFQEKGLIDLLRKHTKSNAQELLNTFFAEVKTFTKGMDQMDDMTLIVIKCTG